jgi:hypothetical protein
VPVIAAFVLVRFVRASIKSGKIVGRGGFIGVRTYYRVETPAVYWFFLIFNTLVGLAMLGIVVGLIVSQAPKLTH